MYIIITIQRKKYLYKNADHGAQYKFMLDIHPLVVFYSTKTIVYYIVYVMAQSI